MTNFKRALLAAVMTLLLSLWLFGFQLQAQGVGLAVVSRLDGNGFLLLAGVLVVFFGQLFRGDDVDCHRGDCGSSARDSHLRHPAL